MKLFFFFLTGLLFSSNLVAQEKSFYEQQENSFEQQWVQLANGEERLLWIRFNEETDLLHCKENGSEREEKLKATEVVSFRYGGHDYYTLPLRDGFFTFFRVLHEGKEFAIMEKYPNFKTLRMIADDSGGYFSVCQNKRSKEFYLCRLGDQGFTTLPSTHGPPTPISNSNSTRQYTVEKLVYLAVEGKLKLFYMESNERFYIWDDLVSLKPGKRGVEKMLEEFIPDEIKREMIWKKVKENKLDLRDPAHLIVALEAVYH